MAIRKTKRRTTREFYPAPPRCSGTRRPGTWALRSHQKRCALAFSPSLHFARIELGDNGITGKPQRRTTPQKSDGANSAPHGGKAYRFREFSQIRHRNREHPHVHLIKRVRRAASSVPTCRGVHEDFINPLNSHAAGEPAAMADRYRHNAAETGAATTLRDPRGPSVKIAGAIDSGVLSSTVRE